MMEAACRGARSRRGRTLGILPGEDREAANGWVEIAIATGLGELRNGLVVRAADAVVADRRRLRDAVGGRAGAQARAAGRRARNVGRAWDRARFHARGGARPDRASFGAVTTQFCCKSGVTCNARPPSLGPCRSSAAPRLATYAVLALVVAVLGVRFMQRQQPASAALAGRATSGRSRARPAGRDGGARVAPGGAGLRRPRGGCGAAPGRLSAARGRPRAGGRPARGRGPAGRRTSTASTSRRRSSTASRSSSRRDARVRRGGRRRPARRAAGAAGAGGGAAPGRRSA